MAGSKTDKQRVLDYLNRLMAGRFFSIEDLDAMTVDDLLDDTPVHDIKEKTLRNALEEFKRSYKSEIFRDY